MPAHKSDLKRFRAVLESKPPEYWGMIRKQYRRYLNNEMPAEFAWLLDRPELLFALVEDYALYAERKRQEGETPDE